MSKLSVRELNTGDVDLIANYWIDSEPEFMVSMGVDLNKLPGKEPIKQMLLAQLKTPLEQRNACCLIWEIDGIPVGHCNTNPTTYGVEAYMHLHLWNIETRKRGFGAELVIMCLPYFFEKLQLKKLYSQPYALNTAPNKTLEKAGFALVKEYVTIPGPLNFEQPVKLWKMSRETYDHLNQSLSC